MNALVAAAVLAGARVAVHPLDLADVPADQRDAVQAAFDVKLARVPEIRLAGSEGVEEAVAKPAGRGCASRDACLRFVAESTESQYALYAGLHREGGEVHVAARVVRSDGVVVRHVSLSDAAGAERALLGKVVDALALNELEPTVPENGPFAFGGSESSPRRPVGFTLMGAGIATMVAGAVMGGLAMDGDRRQSDAAVVLIPMGAVFGLAGGLLALWPSAR